MDFNPLNNEGTLYRIAEWVSRLVYLNILWILFSLLGLGLFGIMPATAAMFGVINQMLSGSENIKIFREYWQYYKKYIIKMNLIGLIMVLIGVILYIDLDYFNQHIGWHYTLIRYFLYLLILLYILDFIYVFPITLKYEIKIRYIIKNALSFVFLTPLEVVQIVLGLVVIIILFTFLPSLLPFLAISLPVFWVARISTKSIHKVESKIIENRNKK